MSAAFADFLTWEKTTRDTLDFKKIYIDMAGGDILAGLALSEIVYWHLPNNSGASRLRVLRDNQYWIAIPRSDWWKRCRLTPRQADRVLNLLKKVGLIMTKLFKWNNIPTIHIQIVEAKFVELWNHFITHPAENPFLADGEDDGFDQEVNTPISPNGEILDFTKRLNLKTETTTETTSETLTSPSIEGEAGADAPEDLARARAFLVTLVTMRAARLNEPTHQRLFGEICRVLGIDTHTMTPKERERYGGVAKQLRLAHARPSQLEPFKRWLDAQKEAGQWTDYTVNVMETKWSQFLAATAPKPRITRPPTMPILTLQEKMAKARLIRSLYAQDRGAEAAEVRDDDPRIADFLAIVG